MEVSEEQFKWIQNMIQIKFGKSKLGNLEEKMVWIMNFFQISIENDK